MERIKKLIASLIASLLVCSAFLPATAQAAWFTFDPERECQLGIRYSYDGTPVANAVFDVWKVAAHQFTDSILVLTGSFADYPVELNGLTDSQLQNAAVVLNGYAQTDAIAPEYTVATDAQGQARLTGLPCGVYLVAGRPLSTDTGRYVTEPQLIVLPQQSGSEWDYHPTIHPKASFQQKSEYLTDRKVIKEWADNGNTTARPASITVHLLCDGAVYDTVTLTKENYWRHAWLDLPLDHTWTVSEEVPTGYTVSIRQEGITFVVTNTIAGTPPPTPTPPPPNNIEQTGLLWWPVPVLAFVGLGLVGLGMIARKRNQDEG